MTKIKFNPTNKLPVWLAVWGVIILAGLALLIVFAVNPSVPIFNPSSSMADHKEFTVTYDLSVEMNDDYKEKLESICNKELSEISVRYEVGTTTTGGSLTYWVDENLSDQTLETAWSKIYEAIQNDSELSTEDKVPYGTYSYTIAPVYVQPATTYIWRAAISGAVLLVIASLYVLIRFSVPMGLTTLISGIADVAVMLALTIILRVPVTSVLAPMAVFALLYSVLLSAVSFSGMRKLLKSEEYKDMSIKESMAAASGASFKGVAVLSICVAVIGACLAIFCGEAIRAAAFSIILAAVASAFSALCVKPALVTAFRLQGKKIKDSKIEKQRLAKQAEEQKRAEKRAAASQD